jgi:hypothetical protein
MSLQLLQQVIQIEESFGLNTFSLDGEIMVRLEHSQSLFEDCDTDCINLLREMRVFTTMDGAWCIRREQQPDEDATDDESFETESLEIYEKKFQEWMRQHGVQQHVFEQHFEELNKQNYK